MESVAVLLWNRWQLCHGISGNFHVELMATLPWNTQLRNALNINAVYMRELGQSITCLSLPLLRGRYSTSALVWGHPTSSGSSGFLPVCRLCRPPSFPGRTHRTSRVPDFALVTCPGLRPRRVRQSPSHSGSFAIAFHLVDSVGTHAFMSITGLNPFTLAHYGPSPPCVRFVVAVTGDDATRGTRCLARASGGGTCLRLTKPSLARRTNNLTKPGFIRQS